MRIATFTINNVNRRLPAPVVGASKPDIVRQQELSTEAGFPADKRRQHDLRGAGKRWAVRLTIIR